MNEVFTWLTVTVVKDSTGVVSLTTSAVTGYGGGWSSMISWYDGGGVCLKGPLKPPSDSRKNAG